MVFFHTVEVDLTQRCQFQSFMLTVAQRCLTNMRLIGNSPEPKLSISEGGKGGEKSSDTFPIVCHAGGY